MPKEPNICPNCGQPLTDEEIELDECWNCESNNQQWPENPAEMGSF